MFICHISVSFLSDEIKCNINQNVNLTIMKALGLYDFILRGFVWAYKWEGVYKQNK